MSFYRKILFLILFVGCSSGSSKKTTFEVRENGFLETNYAALKNLKILYSEQEFAIDKKCVDVEQAINLLHSLKKAKECQMYKHGAVFYAEKNLFESYTAFKQEDLWFRITTRETSKNCQLKVEHGHYVFNSHGLGVLTKCEQYPDAKLCKRELKRNSEMNRLLISNIFSNSNITNGTPRFKVMKLEDTACLK